MDIREYISHFVQETGRKERNIPSNIGIINKYDF